MTPTHTGTDKDFQPTGYSGQTNPLPKMEPCPFCGGEPEIKTEINIHPIRSYAVHTIKCTKCPCSITVVDVTEDEVVRLWNRRVKE